MIAQAAESVESAQGGLGIGLALVRRLVTLHGGQEWAERAGRRRGATFTVRLPGSGPAAPSGQPSTVTRLRPPCLDA